MRATLRPVACRAVGQGHPGGFLSPRAAGCGAAATGCGAGGVAACGGAFGDAALGGGAAVSGLASDGVAAATGCGAGGAAACSAGLGAAALGGGTAATGLASVFGGLAWVPPLVACSLPAGSVFPSAPVLVGFARGGAALGFASLAATTPLPVSSPGLDVAAIAG
jgi:hypothetical protein